MGSGTYLEIVKADDDQILGESEGRDYELQIDITGWDWSVADNSSKKTGTSTGPTSKGANKASGGGGEVGILPALFTFTKPVDRATTQLMWAMSDAEKLKQATFTVREELVSVRDESQKAFLLYVVLEKVTVLSYRLTARSSEHRVDLEETWGLDYEKISFLYETERVQVEFDRPPGSDKKGAPKSQPDVRQLEKQLLDLKQDAEAKAKVKGKGG